MDDGTKSFILSWVLYFQSGCFFFLLPSLQPVHDDTIREKIREVNSGVVGGKQKKTAVCLAC